MCLLRRGQHRHFSAAGATPCGPQIQYQRRAPELLQINLATLQIRHLQRRQWHLALLPQLQYLAPSKPEQYADQGRCQHRRT
ncbi:hypothetical protein G6F50_018002 [Rhizopus delemar]|uniref:Uncharacterized protein n=1 Tax=Rhizopus delemar TaxID=936053 RepID=A0A9P6XPH7_9FUNG|nr:hypothetical protein G6F50_018002 [Rhizopus delemar]